jgi:hypothetical protein
MEENNIQPQPQKPTSTYTAVGDGRGKKILFSVVIILLLFAVMGLAWQNYSGRQTEEVVTIPEMTQELTEEFTPPAVVVDREIISIRILNASGVAGEATKLKEQLEELGYFNVEVGNADAQDAVVTTVSYLSGLEDEISDEITQKLSEIYQSVETTFTNTGEYDIDILLGLRQGQLTATPTQTPTLTPTLTLTPTPIEEE